MSEHKVTLTWQRGETPFEYPKYPRDHTWKFDGGHEMQATVAPAYLGNPKLVDPEEAFVASLGLGLTGISFVAAPLAAGWCALSLWLGRRQAKQRNVAVP